MNLYDRYVLPRVLHFSCGLEVFTERRRQLVPAASGRVLEVGAGSGLNFPFYDPARVESLVALEPEPGMQPMARRAAASLAFPVELVGLRGEEIPLDDHSVDTVLITYTLCTIPDVETALRQMHRVLRPGGQLLFCEHGRAPDAAVRRWQDRFTPAWKKFVGGCHLNRDIPALIERGGFRTGRLESAYLRGWKPLTFTYWGSATP